MTTTERAWARPGTCIRKRRPRGAVDDAQRSRPVHDRGAIGARRKSTKVINQNSAKAMVTPVGVGDFAVGFSDRTSRRRLVLRAFRRQLGLSMPGGGALCEGIWGRDHDQRTSLGAHDRRSGESRREGLRVGCVGQGRAVKAPARRLRCRERIPLGKLRLVPVGIGRRLGARGVEPRDLLRGRASSRSRPGSAAAAPRCARR